jgi:hypothetical protein
LTIHYGWFIFAAKMNTNHKTHSIMKKTFIIIATLFTFFTVQAQENYIISTLYEPDTCYSFQATPGYPYPDYYDTLKLDLNQNGSEDAIFYAVHHPSGGYMIYLRPAIDWKWSYVGEYDSIFPPRDTIDETLAWHNQSVSLDISEQPPFNYDMPPYWAFRYQAEDGIHYGWMYLYARNQRVCFSSMGYCTLPNTPIQWGQTELMGVGENKHETTGILHPNPTTDIVHIEGAEVSEVQVYNALGQWVKTVQNTNEVSLEGLPQGVYLLRVSMKDGKVFSEKVVKN